MTALVKGLLAFTGRHSSIHAGAVTKHYKGRVYQHGIQAEPLCVSQGREGPETLRKGPQSSEVRLPAQNPYLHG